MFLVFTDRIQLRAKVVNIAIVDAVVVSIGVLHGVGIRDKSS